MLLNASSGIQLWNYTTVDGDDVTSSPAVVDGVIYVGSEDGNVYALNASSGIFSTLELHNWLPCIWVTSSPAVVDGAVYVSSSDGNVYALNAAEWH